MGDKGTPLRGVSFFVPLRWSRDKKGYVPFCPFCPAPVVLISSEMGRADQSRNESSREPGPRRVTLKKGRNCWRNSGILSRAREVPALKQGVPHAIGEP